MASLVFARKHLELKPRKWLKIKLGGHAQKVKEALKIAAVEIKLAAEASNKNRGQLLTNVVARGRRCHQPSAGRVVISRVQVAMSSAQCRRRVVLRAQVVPVEDRAGEPFPVHGHGCPSTNEHPPRYVHCLPAPEQIVPVAWCMCLLSFTRTELLEHMQSNRRGMVHCLPAAHMSPRSVS